MKVQDESTQIDQESLEAAALQHVSGSAILATTMEPSVAYLEYTLQNCLVKSWSTNAGVD